jgi:hypothetical protein
MIFFHCISSNVKIKAVAKRALLSKTGLQGKRFQAGLPESDLVLKITGFSFVSIGMNPQTPSLGGVLYWGTPPDPCQKVFWTSF